MEYTIDLEYLTKTPNGDAPWEYFGKELAKEDLIYIAQEFPANAMRETGIGTIRIGSKDENLASYKDNMPRPFGWNGI